MAFVRRNESGHYRVAIALLDDLEDFRYLTTSEDGFWYHRAPDFSPDGRFICYNSARDLWVVSIDGGRPRKLTNDNLPTGESEWFESGIVYSKMNGASRALWRLDPEGGEGERLTTGGSMENQASPGMDGTVLVYSTQWSQSDIRVVDYRTGTVHRIADIRDPDQPTLAPDGSGVVFTGNVREGGGLFLQELDGGQPVGRPRVLMAPPVSVANPVLSPDGRWVAFHRVLDGRRDIWCLSVDGGLPLQFTTDPARDVSPFFSADGRHLAFASERSGRFQIWWAAFDEGRRVGEPVRLTFGETTDYLPRISPDGSMLAWLGNRNNEESLWVRSLKGAREGRLLTPGRRISDSWWERGSETVLASGDWEDEFLSLRRVSVRDGTIERVDLSIDFGQGETGGSGFPSGAISVSADGRFSVFTHTRLTGDLWVMEAEGVDRDDK
jgi:Tol biopolymer transport system component